MDSRFAWIGYYFPHSDLHVKPVGKGRRKAPTTTRTPLKFKGILDFFSEITTNGVLADWAPAANAGRIKTKRPKTTSEMIVLVMREMGTSLEPREIANAIDAKGWGPINRDAVRTRIWHMVKDDKLLKDGAAYSLPPGTEKPVGDNSEGNEPTGLFEPRPDRAGLER